MGLESLFKKPSKSTASFVANYSNEKNAQIKTWKSLLNLKYPPLSIITNRYTGLSLNTTPKIKKKNTKNIG